MRDRAIKLRTHPANNDNVLREFEQTVPATMFKVNPTIIVAQMQFTIASLPRKDSDTPLVKMSPDN